jgi:single-strand DNA-binding protein
MNLNKVFIIGRITNDIVLKATTTNQAVTTFNVATNRVWTDKSGQKQEEAEFHTVVVWGRQAELASQFLSKGSLVLIEGRLRTRTWKDSNNQNRKVTEIICERMQFGPRSAGSSGFKTAQPPASKSAAESVIDESTEELPQISVGESLEDEIKPEDLPF